MQAGYCKQMREAGITDRFMRRPGQVAAKAGRKRDGDAGRRRVGDGAADARGDPVAQPLDAPVFGGCQQARMAEPEAGCADAPEEGPPRRVVAAGQGGLRHGLQPGEHGDARARAGARRQRCEPQPQPFRRPLRRQPRDDRIFQHDPERPFDPVLAEDPAAHLGRAERTLQHRRAGEFGMEARPEKAGNGQGGGDARREERRPAQQGGKQGRQAGGGGRHMDRRLEIEREIDADAEREENRQPERPAVPLGKRQGGGGLDLFAQSFDKRPPLPGSSAAHDRRHPVRPLAHRLSAYRGGAHGAVQLAVRPRAGGAVPAAHRRYRPPPALRTEASRRRSSTGWPGWGSTGMSDAISQFARAPRAMPKIAQALLDSRRMPIKCFSTPEDIAGLPRGRGTGRGPHTPVIKASWRETGTRPRHPPGAPFAIRLKAPARR